MKSKNLKIIGEIILVLSFVTQSLLFDYYNEKSNSLDKAYANQSLIDKGAELKELKYFVATFPGDTAASKQYQRLNINMAARKIAQSQMMAIIGSEKPKKEQVDMANLLLQKAQTVSDFGSYMEYIDFVNNNSIQPKDIIDNIENIESSKKIWRIVFIALYLIGTGFLIYSRKFEKE